VAQDVDRHLDWLPREGSALGEVSGGPSVLDVWRGAVRPPDRVTPRYRARRA
jgi:hypothetical protein